MNRDRSSSSKMKVSSRLRIPGLSKKSPAFSSSPNLTKVGSSDSLDVDYQYLADCHHKSYEDIPKETNHVIHPSSRTADRELVHPSCFYEWSEDFKQHVKPEETPVSEGYSRLRIFDESESKTSTTSSTTSNDYSVLNIDAIEMPSNEERDVSDDEMIKTATKNHNYFTLEVLDDTTRGNTKGVPPAGNPQDVEESQGLYFTIDKQEKVQHSSAGVYSYIDLDTDENGPSVVPRRPNSGMSSVSPYLTFKNTSNDDNAYDSLRHCTTKLQSQNHMRQDQSNVYSYIELDTDENGPSIVPRRPNTGISSGKISPSFRTTSKKDVTYDSLRNSTVKPPRSVRSISQSDQNHFYEKLWNRTPSPKSSKSRPTSLYKTSISPPLIPYHKRDQKVQSCNNIMNGDNTYSKLKYSNTKTGLTKTHSPPTTLCEDYDMVHIIQTEDGDSDSVLTDDDVSIVLSPTSPPPPEKETLSNNSSHTNLVQLIITDDGPLLMPRKRSCTVDASNLRQFRNQSKYNNELRPSSAARN